MENRAPLTMSAARTWNLCKRKYEIQYILGYSPVKKSDALNFGTEAHTLLERYWLGHTPVSPSYGPSHDKAKLSALILGYAVRWRDDDIRKYRVVAAEHEFVTKDGRFAGKIDVIVLSLEDGKLYVVEHKTTSEDISLGSDYWLKLRLDEQVSMYSMAVKEKFPQYEFGGVIYDVLKKTKKEPLKATPVEERKYTKKDGKLYANQRENDEAPNEYFNRIMEDIIADPNAFYQRRIVTRTDAEIEEFKKELVLCQMESFSYTLGTIFGGGLYPRNPSACFIYHSRCPWHDVCCGVDSLDNKDRYVKLDKVNQELVFDVDSL